MVIVTGCARPSAGAVCEPGQTSQMDSSVVRSSAARDVFQRTLGVPKSAFARHLLVSVLSCLEGLCRGNPNTAVAITADSRENSRGETRRGREEFGGFPVVRGKAHPVKRESARVEAANAPPRSYDAHRAQRRKSTAAFRRRGRPGATPQGSARMSRPTIS